MIEDMMAGDEVQYRDQISAVAQVLRGSKSILAITGAGISAESGLPTYRGIGGLYNDDKLTEDDVPIEMALSGQMMQVRPELTWRYLSQIESACRFAKHNTAHEILVEMESSFERVVVLTQNVDGFHRTAGSSNIIDIHGDISRIYCTRCDYRNNEVDYETLNIPPSCPECATVLRPDVVLFGEYLDPAKTSHLQAELEQGFDLIFSIGTTSVFPYISSPIYNASRSGIPTVEINPSETDVSGYVDYKFSRGAVEVLSDIWALLG